MLYTSGFAANSFADLLTRVAFRGHGIAFRHWGDADEHGLRIWDDLRRRTGAAIEWWRTSGDWVTQMASRSAGSTLAAGDRKSLTRLAAHWRSLPFDPLRIEALNCLDAILQTGRMIEQEAYAVATDDR